MIEEIVKKNRSYRRYAKTPAVTEQDLIDLISLTRYCASAGNLQKLRYLPVSKQDDVTWLTEKTKWAAYLKDWDGPKPEEYPTAFLLLLSPTETGVSGIDVGIAAQTILLSAVERGFGGCMLLNVPKEETAERFGFAGEMKIELAISLGTPGETVSVTDVKNGEVKYYRENNTHFVPKLTPDKLIFKKC